MNSAFYSARQDAVTKNTVSPLAFLAVKFYVDMKNSKLKLYMVGKSTCIPITRRKTYLSY